ncbi:MAG TPA: phytanoyl-CoA dioxygenase family protein [Microthrixaceae bacterium]|nr:phytanoyl-CoA dioxygenase family protein [Microthrixaceae bacterium]
MERTAKPAISDAPDMQRLQRDGWTSFRLLPAGELLAAGEAIADRYDFGRTGMTYANIDADRSFIYHVNAVMDPLWELHLLPRFPGFRVLFTTCVVKMPGAYTNMDAHDDGTFVLPPERSITVWVPLVECSDGRPSGAIRVLPGSHLVGPPAAAAGAREWHRRYRHSLTAAMSEVPTNVGDAVVWDGRLLHSSGENRTDQPRFAVVAALVPHGARPVHIEALNTRRRRVYNVDSGFFLDHSSIAVRHVMPDYPVADEFDEDPTTVTSRQVAELCGLDAPPRPETDRPSHDWYPPVDVGAPAPPAADDCSVDDAIEMWTRQTIGAIRGRRAIGWTGLGFWDTDLVTDRCVGSWGAIDLVRDGSMTPAGAELLGAVVAATLPTAFDRAVLVSLGEAPPVSLSIPAAPGSPEDLIVALVTPASGAGVANAGGAARFDLGWPVRVPRDTAFQVWNDGREPMPFLLLRPPRAPTEPPGWNVPRMIRAARSLVRGVRH